MKKSRKASKGLTIAEMLVALLIMGMTSVAIAMGISAGAKSQMKSVSLSEVRVLSSTLSQKTLNELRFAENMTFEGNELKTFVSRTCGAVPVSFSFEDGILKLGGKPIVPISVYLDGKLAVTDFAVTRENTGDLICLNVEMQISSVAIEDQTVTFKVYPLNPPK